MNNVAIGVGLLVGLAFGVLAAATGSEALVAVALGVAPIGTAFINAIQMVVIPLVVTVVFVGVAGLGDPRRLGRLGGLSLAFFWGTTVPAILIGMGVMRIGLRFVPPVPPPGGTGSVAPELPGFVDFLLGLIPRNPFAAAVDGSLLPLIVFTVLVAAAAGTLEAEHRDRLTGAAESLSAALIQLVHWILWTAPIGVFGLIAPIAAEAGWAVLQSLAVFILAVVIGLFLFMGAVFMPLVRVFGRIAPGAFVRGTLGTYAIGFTTTSSVASLPVMLEEARDNLGVRTSVATLVLPLAASLNRPGSALFQGASVVYLAHLFDAPFGLVQLGGVVLAVFLAASTVAPVPSASIVTLAPALTTAGVPLDGLALLLGVDRIPDMFRSATNMIGHMAAARVVEQQVGEGVEPSRPSSGASPETPAQSSEASMQTPPGATA